MRTPLGLLSIVLPAMLLTVHACGKSSNGPGPQPTTGGAIGSGGGAIASGGTGAGGAATDGTTAADAGNATDAAMAVGGSNAATGGTGAGGVDAGGPTATGGRAGSGAGGATSSVDGGASSSTFKVLDQIPQFGIYAEENPKNYQPPTGMLMWSFGTLMATKLSAADKARISSKLAARITYHAQCDNYDRLGSLFYIVKPAGVEPVETDPRVEIVRYITPFSDYNRGALATYAFPDADVSAYASTLADATRDVWLGIASGANPYDGDPCTKAQVTPEFRQVGYKISVDLVTSGEPLTAPGTMLSAKSYKAETSLPINGTFENAEGTRSGRVTIIISGHGSEAGGCEYMNTEDVLRVNDVQIGTFSTKIDCASYAKYSPDGNQGIFRNNGSNNPRNWCPGALVPSHTYPVTLNAGTNKVSLSVSPTNLPSGSYYSTTINFTSP